MGRCRWEGFSSVVTAGAAYIMITSRAAALLVFLACQVVASVALPHVVQNLGEGNDASWWDSEDPDAKHVIKSVVHKVMRHAADCRQPGASAADIAGCVRRKSQADLQHTSARKVRQEQKIRGKARARRALRKKVRQVAKQSFELQHPNAKARLRRQRARKNKLKKTKKQMANKQMAKQMAKKQMTAKTHPLKY